MVIFFFFDIAIDWKVFFSKEWSESEFEDGWTVVVIFLTPSTTKQDKFTEQDRALGLSIERENLFTIETSKQCISAHHLCSGQVWLYIFSEK